jgi:multidrug efflux pump subunit AcrB
MNISELSLRRPVLAFVMNIILVLFGIIGFNFLGVRDYPAIDPPNVSVRTNYPGANADIIESQITEPLEKSVNGIPGIKNITSSSSVGQSNITMSATKYRALPDRCPAIWIVRRWCRRKMQVPTRSSP